MNVKGVLFLTGALAVLPCSSFSTGEVLGAEPPVAVQENLGIPLGEAVTTHSGAVGEGADYSASVLPIQLASVSYRWGAIRLGIISEGDLDMETVSVNVYPYVPVRVGDGTLSWMDGIDREITLWGNFTPATRYRITLKAGLKDKKGGVLEEDAASNILIPDLATQIQFVNSGNFMPISSEKLLFHYRSVNCDEVDALLLRTYDNNLNLYHDAEWLKQGKMEEIGVKKIRYDDPKNKEVIHEFDLESILKERKPGVYRLILSARSKDRPLDSEETCLDFTLTDMALQATTDASNSQIILFLRSIGTGTPIAGASVTVLSRKNQIVAQGKSNAKGSLTLKYDLAWNRESDSVEAVVAKKGEDITYFPLDSSLPIERKGAPYLANEPKAFVFAERGACRPGESFCASAFLRQEIGNEYKPLKEVPVVLLVKDPRGRQFAKTQLKTDEYGFVQTSFEVPETAQTGLYEVSCQAMGSKQNCGRTEIQVASYVPDRIQVSGKCLTEDAKMDEPLTFEFDAQYYFGVPVQDVNYEGKVFSDCNGPLPHWDSSWSFGGTAFYKPASVWYFNGKALTLPIQFTYPGFQEKRGEAFEPFSLCAEMTVSEPGGRGVTKMEKVLINPTPWYIGLREGKSKRGMKTLEYTLLPVEKESTALLKEETEMTFLLIRDEWDYVFTKGADGTFKREWIQREYPLSEQVISETLPAGTPVGGWVKEVSWDLPSGIYRLIAKSGNDYKSILSFTHYSGEGGGRTSNPNTLYFKTDASSYLPGQEVTFSFDAFGDGQAFLIAGEKKMEEKKMMDVKRGKNEIKMTLPRDLHSSSYFIGCTVVSQKGETPIRSFGMLEVPVEQRPQHQLAVGLVLPEMSAPGQEVSIDLSLKNDKGEPQSGLVSLYAVDSGVVSLTKYQAPDIFSYFYGRIACPMDFYDMYGEIFEKLVITRDGKIGGDGDEDGGSGKLFNIKQKRTARVICPAVQVREGKATVQVQLPEHVGAMDVFAVASSESAVGSTSSTIKMRNPLTVTVSAPRYMAPKDEALLSFTLFNTDLDESDYTCTLTLPKFLKALENTNLIFEGKLPKGTQTNRVLRVQAQEAFGADSIVAELAIGKEKTRSETDVTIRNLYVAETSSEVFVLEPGEKRTLASKSGDYVLAPQVRLHLSSSPALAVESALDWLNHYPYGCLEQTVAMAFPFVGVPAMVQSGMLSEEVGNTVRSKVQGGYANILQMGLWDGSFSMWPGGKQAWSEATLFAHHFIFEAVAQKLLSIGERDRNRYLDYLRGVANNASPANRNNRAYAIYILAVSGDKDFIKPARNMVLDAKKADYALMLAGAALIKGGYANIGIRPLEAALNAQCWKQEGVPTEYSDEVCRIGMALYILMDCNCQQDELAARLALELAGRVQEDSTAWGTTQANAWASLGLAAYAQKYPAVSVQAILRGSEPEQTLDIEKPIVLDGAAVREIENTSEGILIVETRTSGIPKVETHAQNETLTLSKEYLNQKGKPVSHLAHGEKIFVRIRLNSPVALKNVVIADLLPAGLEIEDDSLATRSSSKGSEEVLKPVPSAMNANRYEKRDDRFLIFGDTNPGESVFVYQARGVIRGTFAVPPLHAEAMYNPQMKGASRERKQLVID